ncbi:hypothetical protein ACKP2L_06535 [Oenococcus alcoholitolerans]|uniref:hypothetical protein n=1 Tax=Oenococcus alcoholitolerans TaxID=931074 RepID=UPI003F726E75
MSELISERGYLPKTFKRLVRTGKLNHAYLFLGNDLKSITDLLTEICREILAEKNFQTVFNDPNIVLVQPDQNKKSISIEQTRQLKDLFFQRSDKPRIALIFKADQMTEPAANSILKFIEEPFENQYIFLTAKSVNQILPTILSRVQQVKVASRSGDRIKETLSLKGCDSRSADFLAELSQAQWPSEDLIEPTFAKELYQLSHKWIDLIFDKNPLAFPFVQTELTDIITDKNKLSIFFAAIENILSKKLAGRPDLKHARVLEKWLLYRNQAKYNLSHQLLLEDFSLSALNILERDDGTKEFSR